MTSMLVGQQYWITHYSFVPGFQFGPSRLSYIQHDAFSAAS